MDGSRIGREAPLSLQGSYARLHYERLLTTEQQPIELVPAIMRKCYFPF